MAHDAVYGLDIETGYSTTEATETGGPIDPRRAPITCVALSTPAQEWVLQGDEADLLDDLDELLEDHEPGILATWNGSGFGLPFLADRAAIQDVQLGLHLAADPRLRPRGELLAGHRTGYRAVWHGHRHLDVARLYRSGRRPLVEVSELFRSLSRHVRIRPTDGIGPADAPGEELTHDATHAFASNDARLVRSMTETRLPGVIRHVDRVTVPARDAPSHVADAADRLRGRMDAVTPRASPAHPAVRAALAKSLATPRA